METVKQFRVPYDLLTLRQFLGLASFYRIYVSNFAKIPSPLHNLIRKGVPSDLTEACQTAFDLL